MNSVEEALEDIKKGKLVIVVDDEDRENEGDFVTAARNANPELINFMATHGRGLICTPLIEERCDELGLEMMVDSNNSHFDTPFTVSIDLIGNGCSTGISATDRAKTVKALIDPNTKPKDLGKPGHIFPLRAKAGGVLRRAGHTEAAVDLSRLAGFEAAGLIVEIMNEYPSMVVELGSHTDCRASQGYNRNLSDRRAKSSANFIKERISNPQRIYGKGFGESKLKNKCECEGTRIVPCSEEEHQENRRTEFLIITM